MATSRFRIPFITGQHPASTKDNTYPFPHTSGTGVMTLADIVGPTAAAQIEKTGELQFHTLGDSGKGPHTAQQDVAEAMARDINPKAHQKSPAFLMHLGDVIYGDGKENLYDDEFYRPYADYPNKIVAIPGNHDGEEGVTMDKVSLKAFMDNFCAKAGTEPPLAKTFQNEMVKQPGVYWMLESKLLNLVALYSNAGENSGTLGDNKKLGTHQLDWLEKTLKGVAKQRAAGTRKALILAMHHPPFARGLSNQGFGHGGSAAMLDQLDRACKAAGIWPDAVLSGHSHNYQRYSRNMPLNGKVKGIAYLVVGTGGFAIQPAPSGVGNTVGDVTYVNGSPPKGLVQPHQPHSGYGYMTVRVRKTLMEFTFIIVQGNHRQPFETVSVPLN
jgi:predicted phosphodiesterase